MKNDLMNTLPGSDNILRKDFSNGVTVLVHENPGSCSTALRGSVFAGSCLDLPEKTGLSAFVSAALTAGQGADGSCPVSTSLENIGADLSFHSDPHSITFSGKCLSEDLPELLRLLKKSLDEPDFPEPCVENLRRQALAGYHPDDDDPEDPAYLNFKELLWGEDHPCGRPPFGPDEMIRNITPDDLADFHRRFFGPKKFILALAGGFQSREVMDRCEEMFGSWEKDQEKTDEDALFPPVEWRWGGGCVRSHSVMDGCQDVSLVIGAFGPAAGEPDSLSARLGNIILGHSDLTGRIPRRVREENGLAYSVFSNLECLKKGGSWSVNARVAPEDLEKAGEMIMEELIRFNREPVSLRELEDAKAWYIGSKPLGLAGSTAKATALHRLAYFQFDPDIYRLIPEQAAAVTPETVLEAARKWLDPDTLVISSAGPRLENGRGGLWYPSAS